MRSTIENNISTYLSGTKYGLIDLNFRGEKSNVVLEVFVDSEGDILLDDLGVMNKEIWEMLEEKMLTKNLSKIIVSSPGTDKNLKYFWQLKKHLGRILMFSNNYDEKIEGKLIELIDLENEKFSVEIKNKKEVTAEEYFFKDVSDLKVKIKF